MPREPQSVRSLDEPRVVVHLEPEATPEDIEELGMLLALSTDRSG